MRFLLPFATVALLGGCSFLTPDPLDLKLPASLGEQSSNASYVPFDPLPVFTERGRSCIAPTSTFQDLLTALPDNAVRMAIGQYDDSGGLSFGPIRVGTKSNRYQVILDYINADSTQIPFAFYRQEINNPENTHPMAASPKAPTQIITRRMTHDDPLPNANANASKVVIPVYVGVGLRLTANITVLDGNVNLSSIGSLAAEAQRGRIAGSLMVQTLGITGKQVSTILPMPSELNQTTVQNAIMSLGSIKSIMYNEKDVTTTARVIGIYNPIPNSGPDLVNTILSELAKSPIPWYRPCSKDS